MPYIAWCVMPAERTTVARVRLAAFVITAMIVLAVVTSSDAVFGARLFHPIIPLVLGSTLLGFAVQAVKALLPTRRFGGSIDESSEIQRAVAAIDAGTPRLIDAPEHLWEWNRLQRSCPQPRSARPRTIADAALRTRLMDPPLPDYLLEPEEIVPAGGHARSIIFAAGVLSLVIMYILAAISVWLMVLFMLAVFFAATSIAPVRRRIALMAPIETALIAGQGWVREPNGRVWTTDDAMLIVTQVAPGAPLRVFLTGPSGCIRRSFPHHTAPAFINLWQRWNHPDPRPSLAQ